MADTTAYPALLVPPVFLRVRCFTCNGKLRSRGGRAGERSPGGDLAKESQRGAAFADSPLRGRGIPPPSQISGAPGGTRSIAFRKPRSRQSPLAAFLETRHGPGAGPSPGIAYCERSLFGRVLVADTTAYPALLVPPVFLRGGCKAGAPGGTRTHGPLLRSPKKRHFPKVNAGLESSVSGRISKALFLPFPFDTVRQRPPLFDLQSCEKVAIFSTGSNLTKKRSKGLDSNKGNGTGDG